MGNKSSTQGNPGAFYGGAIEEYGGGCPCAGGGVVGGGSGGAPPLGDIADLRDYEKQAYSKAKTGILRDIAEQLAVLGVLKRSKDEIHRMDSTALSHAILAAVPATKKNGKFTHDEPKQVQAIRDLAKAVNRARGHEVISEDQPPNLIVEQFHDTLTSLMSGMQGEFLRIQENARKRLQNLRALGQVLSSVQKDDHALVRKSEDMALNLKFDDRARAKDLLLKELNRQIDLLENLLNVTMKTEDVEIAKLMREQSELQGLSAVGAVPGTPEFARHISQLLRGLGLTAGVAAKVEKALKKVNMTVDEYRTASTKRFNSAIDEAVAKIRDETSAEAREILDAAKVLRTHFNERQDIYKSDSKSGGDLDIGAMNSAGLSNVGLSGDVPSSGPAPVDAPATTGGAGCMMEGAGLDGYDSADGDTGSHAGSYDGAGYEGTSYEGGADYGPQSMFNVNRLNKKIAAQFQRQKEIFNSFRRTQDRHIEIIVRAINTLGAEVGKTVPVTEKLEQLNNSLDRISDVTQLANYPQLTGYYTDASARQTREGLLTGLQGVVLVVDEMLADGQYSGKAAEPLRRLKEAVEGMTRDIDRFQGTVKSVLGVSGGADEVEWLTPSQLGISTVSSSALDLDRAREKIRFNIYLSRVRQNLCESAKQLDEYKENYKQILAVAVGDKLRRISKDQADELEKLDAVWAFKEENLKDNVDPVTGAATTGSNALRDEYKSLRDSARAFLNRQYEARKNFYRVLQAVDLYMQVFTDQIARNPEDIKSIQRLAMGNEALMEINDWFDDSTGNSLMQLFEQFPAMYGTDNFTPEDSTLLGPAPAGAQKHALRPLREGAQKHPYESLAAGQADPATGDLPGVPYNAVHPEVGINVQRGLNKTLTTLHSLKNFLELFVGIGSKFGSEEIIKHKDVFMPPARMYKYLLEFLEVSAMRIRLQDTSSDFVNVVPGNASASAATAAGSLQAGGMNVGSNALVMPAGAVVPNVKEQAAAGVAADVKRVLRSRYYTQMSSVTQKLRGMFDEEQEYFVLIIKAMAAKVFTVMGTFDLFQRPEALTQQAIRSIRTILGGDGSAPAVKEEAIELYLRLPLLLEWYRDLFDVNERASGWISMVSDIEGTFSGLFNLVFNKAKYVDVGSYSESDIRDIVREVNHIYDRYANNPEDCGPETPSRKVIYALVAEVNRRYGLLTKDFKTKYDRMRRFHESGSTDGLAESDRKDYMILPGEEEDFPEGAAPSDAYLTGKEMKIDPLITPDFVLDPKAKELIYKFRSKLNDVYMESDPFAVRPGFQGLLQDSRVQLKSAGSPEERFKVVVRMIQNSTSSSSSSDFMRDVVFHETFTTGMNVLNAICTQLLTFRSEFQQVSLGAPLVEWRKGLAAGTPANVAAFTGMLTPAGGAALPFNAGKFVATALPAGALAVNADQPRIDAYVRATLEPEAMMEHLLTTLMSFASVKGQLVELKFSGDAPYIDSSTLRNTVESLLSFVKEIYTRMRIYLPESARSKYEDSNTAGTIYWIEKQFDELLRGRTEDDVTLDKLNEEIALTFKFLAGPAAYNAAGVKAPTYIQYADLMNALTFYNQSATIPISGGAGTAVDVVTSPDALDRLIGRGVDKNRTYPQGLLRRAQFYTADDALFDENSSCMLWFNQLVAKYINQFFDASSQKIYLPIINRFAQGDFNLYVANPAKTFPDGYGTAAGIGRTTPGATAAAIGVPPAAAAGPFPDPDGENILFTSLAFILNNLTSEKTKQETSRFLITSLAEVPLFMKENYRANLPGFVRLFQQLANRCETYKKLLELLKVERTAAIGACAGWAQPTVAPLTTGCAAKNMQPVLMQVLNTVIRGCQSLIGCAQEVLRELGDSPIYGELGQNSLAEYKSQHNKEAIAPLSDLLYVLGVNSQHRQTLLPLQGMGSEVFKYRYATRGVYGIPVDLTEANLAPALQVIKLYTKGVSNIELVDQRKYLEFAKTVARTMNYFAGAILRRKALNQPAVAYVLIGALPAVLPAGGPFPLIGATDRRAVFPLSLDGTTERPLIEVLALTESGNQQASLEKIAKSIADGGGQAGITDRKAARMTNLMDLNINPINVHAMQREIPLAPTLNYAFTFDQMVLETFIPHGDSAILADTDAAIAAALQPSTSRLEFVNFLANPHRYVSYDEYTTYVARVFRGDDDLGMGRPKLLSGQIFNKVLFGEVFVDSQLAQLGPGQAAEPFRPSNASTNRSELYRGTMSTVLGRATTLTGAEIAVSSNKIIGAMMSQKEGLNGDALIASVGTGAGPTPDESANLVGFAVLVSPLVLAAVDEKLRDPTSVIALSRVEIANALANPGNSPSYSIYQRITSVPAAGMDPSSILKGTFAPINVWVPNADVQSTAVVGPGQGQLRYASHTGNTGDPKGTNPYQTAVNVVNVKDKGRIEQIGKMRFDTTFIRNVYFLTNVWRAVHHKINQDLVNRGSGKISTGSQVLAPGVTQYQGNATYSKPPTKMF